MDNRSPLAKARDDWFASKDGVECADFNSLTFPEYLKNRLEAAFLAGAEAQREIDTKTTPPLQDENMDKETFWNKAIEIVAAHLDAKDQLCMGVSPHSIDHERWKDRYMGRDTHAKLVFNRFKPEVDTLVAKLMQAVDDAAKTPPP